MHGLVGRRIVESLDMGRKKLATIALRKLASLLSIALLTASVAYSEPTPAPSAAPVSAAVAVTQENSTEDRLVERFQAEREVLERQADRQASGISDLIQTMLWVMGAIVAFAAGVFFWTWGSTRNEMLSSIKSVASDQVRQLVEAQALPVRERITSIQRELDELRAMRSAVTWIVRSNDEDNAELLAQFQARNIDVSVVAPAEGEPFLLGAAELVIISYQPTDEGTRKIRETIGQLRQRTPLAPVVIYTFDPARQDNRLVQRDNDALSEYRWYVPANFPLQLIAHVSSLTTNRPVGLRNV